MSLFGPPNIEKMKAKRDIKGLIKALSYQDWRTRYDAAETLGELGDRQSVEALIAALNDKDDRVRRSAVKALHRFTDPRTIGPLVAYIKAHSLGAVDLAFNTLVKIGSPSVPPLISLLGTDSVTSRKAAQALVDIGRPAVKELINVLKHGTTLARESAAEALYEIGDQRAVEPLQEALRDQAPSVRRVAAVGLGKFGMPQSLEPLIAALKDTDKEVREGAAYALGKIREERAVESLIATLEDDSIVVRDSGLLALGEIGGEQAMNALIGALKRHRNDAHLVTVTLNAIEGCARREPELAKTLVIEPIVNGLKDRDDLSMPIAAAELLKRLGEHRSHPETKAWSRFVTGSTEQDRAEAAAKLVMLGFSFYDLRLKGFLDHLRDVCDLKQTRFYADKFETDDEKMELRQRAVPLLELIVGALAKRGDVQGLIQALSDENGYIREKAARALAPLAEPQALAPLIVALKDQRSDVRAAAALALGPIGDWKAVEPLIACLANNWTASESMKALTEITKQDFGSDVALWQSWWAAYKREREG